MTANSSFHTDGFARLSIPASAGVGLKPEHYHEILNSSQLEHVKWFEVHPENYMGAGGPPHRYLTAIRERFPLSLHGVGLSIGGASALNSDHLQRLKSLVDRYQPALFSEHLAWSTHDTHFLNDLLPLPYTQETLDTVCLHIDEVQSYIGRQMLLENPSTYVQFENSTFSETDFITEIVKRTGCGLLLDINNVYVYATNHNYDVELYLASFPLYAVQEIHLAGHATDEDDIGAPLLIDSHDRLVADPVWALYDWVIQRTGAISTLIEWDSQIPTWDILANEARSANLILAKHQNQLQKFQAAQ